MCAFYTINEIQYTKKQFVYTTDKALETQVAFKDIRYLISNSLNDNLKEIVFTYFRDRLH